MKPVWTVRPESPFLVVPDVVELGEVPVEVPVPEGREAEDEKGTVVPLMLN